VKKAQRRAVQRITAIRAAFSLVWNAGPGSLCLWASLLLVLALLPVGVVALTRSLVDSLVAAIRSPDPWQSFQQAIPAAVLFGLILLSSEAIQSIAEWTRIAQSEKIQDHVRDLIHQKCISVDLEFFDSSDFHDHLHRAREDASSRPLSLLESTGTFVQNGITLAGMVALLVPYGWWMAVALLVSSIPALHVVLRTNRAMHRWWERTTTDRRSAQYLDLMLTEGPMAAEVRLFHLGEPFRRRYREIRRRLRTERLALAKRHAVLRLLGLMVALLTSAATGVYVVWQVLQGRMTIGDLTLFYQAFQRGQGLARAVLSSFAQAYGNSLFLANLFEFLSITRRVLDPPHPVSCPRPVREGLRVRNLSFTYPGGSSPVLHNLDLSVSAGQVAAIVGQNGAGKSTLLKLLCRFYDPQSGSIEIDGVDLRRMSGDELRSHISVLFQLPALFQTTVKENIAVGQSNPRFDQVRAAALGAGAHNLISRLPRGYDTVLGRWFPEGVELSAGEWQRIALARAYVREADILILDEPTSFMDSWSEADWMDRVRLLAKGRTAIIITHRFNIARRADVVHVIHEGRVAESGTHDELLRLGGLYAQSPSAQDVAPHAQAVEAQA
jgi:ATP-binding cassette subfamily B protein